MIRVQEVCQKLGISRSTLRNLERRAGLRIARDRANHRRFSESDVQALNQIYYGDKSPFIQEKKNEN